MENADWVRKRTAVLDPPAEWAPDAAAARARFQKRVDAEASRMAWRRRLMWTAAFAGVAVAAVVAAPGARALAQQVWQMLTVKRVAFIRVNQWPEGVPSPPVNLLGLPVPPQAARDAEEARWRVNYVPRLPRPGVLSGAPKLWTTFSLSAGTVIHAADLELALQKAGVTDVQVPRQWDGAQLAIHTSGIVIAEWPDVVLAQSLPLTLTAPPGVDFREYSTLILRVLGVGPDEAQRAAQRMGTVPPWVAPIDPGLEQNFQMEEITLNSGPATLLTEIFSRKDGTRRLAILWSVADRVYLLDGGLSRDLAIAMANAVE